MDQWKPDLKAWWQKFAKKNMQYHFRWGNSLKIHQRHQTLDGMTLGFWLHLLLALVPNSLNIRAGYFWFNQSDNSPPWWWMMMSRIENVLGPTPLLRLPCFFYVALAFPYFHRRIEKERWWFAKLKQRYWWSVLTHYVIIQIMMMLIAPRGDWGGIRRFLHSCSHLGEL